MDRIAQNTRSVVRQFRQVLMALYSGQYDITKISIEPNFDKRIESPGAPVDTGNRILTVKYNILRRKEGGLINPERMDHMEKGAHLGKAREGNKKGDKKIDMVTRAELEEYEEKEKEIKDLEEKLNIWWNSLPMFQKCALRDYYCYASVKDNLSNNSDDNLKD